MRKIIIDTDTATDDSVALIMALLCPDIEILGITTVCGNIPLPLCTANALQTVELCRRDVPVYPGAEKPLYRDLVCAAEIHGKDGMGDIGLVHPTREAEGTHAVDFMLDEIRKAPGEVEIVALGPCTNIATAILKDREAMMGVRHIWSMGTGGFGGGNITPAAEFNVYVDAESYKIMLESGIPVTVCGFDLCGGDCALTERELLEIGGAPLGDFVVRANATRLYHNKITGADPVIDLPDAVAMAAAIWQETVRETVTASCFCCTANDPSYGHVIICDTRRTTPKNYHIPKTNTRVVKEMYPEKFKSRLKELLLSELLQDGDMEQI